MRSAGKSSSFGGIAPALRGVTMTFGGIAPALRGVAMTFGGIAPALRGVAMSVWLLACAQSTTPSHGGGANDAAPERAALDARAGDPPVRDARAGDPPPGRDARAETDARADSGAPPSSAPSCTSQTRPGDVCHSSVDRQCLVLHCGARGQLECRSERWALIDLPWQGDSSPWDFSCAVGDEPAQSFCGNEVQCCGQPVAEVSGCPIEGGCQSCPPSEPEEGSPCTLPPACDDHPGPRVIDCYYPCCCYGQATWAQCDGTRWHINTLCTPK